jgi:hypothetical protein
MDKKLTLSLNQKIIEKAKKYAKRNGTSLSKMIESYFQSITNSQEEEETDIKITPLVESLCGVSKLPKGFDYKKSRIKYLENKTD